MFPHKLFKCSQNWNGPLYIYAIQKRCYKKKYTLKETTNIDRALEYFDIVYPQIYGLKWKRMKKALFSKSKYAALINNFTDFEETVKQFEELGAYDVGAFYSKKVKLFKEEQAMNNPNVTFEELEEESQLRPTKLRPSLIELTDNEKAALAEQPSIARYPEEYKKRTLGVDNSENAQVLDSSRLILSSNSDDIATASLYNYVPATKLKGLDDWVEETDVFVNANDSMHEIGVKKYKEKEPVKWPEHLKLYSFIRGDMDSTFPPPKLTSKNSVSTHYLLDGASILPVLALDLQPKDRVLDVCASPGGKSLTMLQTLLPEQLVCNDLSISRLNRITRVINEYIPQTMSVIRDSVIMSHENGVYVHNPDSFDKVLVDAPCLTDRHSLAESDNSIFKTTRVKERLRMPEMQAQLIISALQSVKPGGSVVYSTCTLSPLQNDGAVHLALTRIWRESKIECTVVDLGSTLRHLSFMYKMGHDLGLRYGHIVLPIPDNNYGPMYFCKINRDR